jgi:hypothetical protein
MEQTFDIGSDGRGPEADVERVRLVTGPFVARFTSLCSDGPTFCEFDVVVGSGDER